MIELTGNSVKYFEKEKNGDNLHFEEFVESNSVLCIVADGISKQPCDWLASETACKRFVANFIRLSESSDQERIEQSIKEVNNFILQQAGDCSGMSATFSLFYWNKSGASFVSNIGDSRVYRCRAGKLD